MFVVRLVRNVRTRLAASRLTRQPLRLAEAVISFLIIRLAGLFDPDWYRLQWGRQIPGHMLPLAHYVWRGRRAGFAPHPLFEPSWFSPMRWHDDSMDPFARFLIRGRVRRAAPHPLFDPGSWVRRHPEAARHRFGPFGHFCESAGPETELPLAEALTVATGGSVSLARARVHLAERLGAWQADERRRKAPRLAATYDGELAAATIARYSARGLALAATAGGEPFVSVIMPVRDRAELVGEAIGSVLGQTFTAWELVVVDDGSTDGTPEVLAKLVADDPRVQVVTSPAAGVSAARNLGAARARGRYVAWLDSDNLWRPDFLATMLGAMGAENYRAAYAIAETVDGTGRRRFRSLPSGDTTAEVLALLEVANHVDLNVLVLASDLLREVGGFDETLRRTVDYDLMWRVARRVVPRLIPFVGVTYAHDPDAADRITVRERASWREVVKNRHLVDWSALAAVAPHRDSTLVSVVVAASADSMGAWSTAVSALGAGAAEVVVVDDQLARGSSLALASLPLADARVTLARIPRRVHRPLATNIGLSRSTHGTVVLVREGVVLWPSALSPLAGAVEQETAPSAQPVIVDGDGTVASAGATWPPSATLPVGLFAGLPVEDARRAGPRLAVRATSGGVLAARAADVIDVRGIDCQYVNGAVDLELTDLSLRLGGAVTVTSSLASTPSPAPAEHTADAGNEELFRSRHPTLDPDDDLWTAAGLRAEKWSGGRPLLTAIPRRGGPDGRPSLRWAIKTAAPAGPTSLRWGDIHFARSLGDALERLGQRVVIDHRPAAARDDHGLDDVVLVLRGLLAVPAETLPPAAVSMLWVISHPDLVTESEVVGYDRVFSAGPAWGQRLSKRAGRPVEPLLQATDTRIFFPGPVSGEDGDREEVLFVGSSRGVYRPVVRHLLEAGFEVGIHGNGWDEFVAPRFWRSRLVANADLPRHYRTAGVVLNDHWADMRVQGFYSNRLFDAAACGARVVSDHVDGVEELFGGLVRSWRTPEELVDLVRRAGEIFPDDATRARLGRSVGEEHSFDHRARVLLDTALCHVGGDAVRSPEGP